MNNVFGLKGSNEKKRRHFRCFINMMFMVISIFAVSCFAPNQSAFSQSQIQIGENIRSIMSGNQIRQYVLYIPAGYDGKTPLPLVLLFHGQGGTPNTVMEITGLSKVAEMKNFFIAAPEAIKKSWNTGYEPAGVNDVEFVKDLIREVSSKMAIDKRRIYATGFSQGGKMSCRLACELSNDIAAIGAVAGLDYPGKCAPSRSVPVITFFGTEDRFYSGGEVFASFWVENNGCQKTPETKEMSKDVNQMTYVSCKKNAEVVLFRINGGGHTWPGSPIPDFLEKLGNGPTNKDVNATILIWSFFEAHPLP